MANAFYTGGIHELINQTFNFVTGTVGVALMSSAYTFSAAHTDFSTISANQLGTTQTLGSKSLSGNQLIGGDVTFSGVAAALTVKAIVLFHNTGGGDGPLFAYSDTGTGLPLTTDGNNIVIHWSGTTPTGNVWRG